MIKTRSRILLAWHVCWFAILLVAYHLQNESCRLVPEQLNRCLTFGGRYIFMTHILQLSSKVRVLIGQNWKILKVRFFTRSGSGDQE